MYIHIYECNLRGMEGRGVREREGKGHRERERGGGEAVRKGRAVV